MGNCCSVQSENNHVNHTVLLKENARSPGVIAQSDETHRAATTEANQSTPMPKNGSPKITVKG